ncbi:hypothetical protein GH714_018632 [Hevea brasiliensis]|uniref:PLAT domain-containing protein n=1 Tax=Hevea brasiliensis TaxID=3981 RepID=A0A6A6K6A9_HEVBR|nr:hypothetical protein GH714_018632 [Hevea brasiliensis]
MAFYARLLCFLLLLAVSTVDVSDRVDHQRRNRLHHQCYALRRLRRVRGDPESGVLGRPDGPDYNYFERGNLDIFSGRGPCLNAPVCALNLTSDGSGPHHGWYCNYVEVTTTGVHTPCSQQQFTVEQWLAIDTAPYELTTIRNHCPSDLGDLKGLDGVKLKSAVM